jgi:hypothetical protein
VLVSSSIRLISRRRIGDTLNCRIGFELPERATNSKWMGVWEETLKRWIKTWGEDKALNVKEAEQGWIEVQIPIELGQKGSVGYLDVRGPEAMESCPRPVHLKDFTVQEIPEQIDPSRFRKVKDCTSNNDPYHGPRSSASGVTAPAAMPT